MHVNQLKRVIMKFAILNMTLVLSILHLHIRHWLPLSNKAVPAVPMTRWPERGYIKPLTSSFGMDFDRQLGFFVFDHGSHSCYIHCLLVKPQSALSSRAVPAVLIPDGQKEGHIKPHTTFVGLNFDR